MRRRWCEYWYERNARAEGERLAGLGYTVEIENDGDGRWVVFRIME